MKRRDFIKTLGLGAVTLGLTSIIPPVEAVKAVSLSGITPNGSRTPHYFVKYNGTTSILEVLRNVKEHQTCSGATCGFPHLIIDNQDGTLGYLSIADVLA